MKTWVCGHALERLTVPGRQFLSTPQSRAVTLSKMQGLAGKAHRYAYNPRLAVPSKIRHSMHRTELKQCVSSTNARISLDKLIPDLGSSTNNVFKNGFLNKFKASDDMISSSISQLSTFNSKSLFPFLALLVAFFLVQEGTSMAQTLTEDSSTTLALSIDSLTDFNDFQSGFASALLLILFSEIGDKTFFIAALLATKKPIFLVFSGTFSALAVMTVISVFLGRIFHIVDEAVQITISGVPIPLDDIAASLLLIYFGISTLVDASQEESKANEEQEEAQEVVASFSGGNSEVLSTFVSVFALVFLAEWGDKSFFSTIALAAASSPLGVVGGAVFGHGIATLLAVLGGSFFGSFVSEKVISYTGGILFLVFAALTWVEIGSKIFY